MSAWIEIILRITQDLLNLVALLVSAWIEIFKENGKYRTKSVALLVSAWIEIDWFIFTVTIYNRRTPRECVD